MPFSLSKAQDYVGSLDLSGTPRPILNQDAAAEAGEDFDKVKAQAQVVGSGVFSFSVGVTAEVRQAISDSALLAQLVANKRVLGEQNPLDWFAAYSEVLQKVGWTIQGSGWTDYSAKGTAVEVHEKIIEVMTVALGPAPAALAIVAATVNALKGMKPDSSWLTIFSRESQKARIARFQIGLVEKGEHDDVLVSMLGCLIEAQNAITQVLFFKFKNANASFRANSTTLSNNNRALADLAPTIREKVHAYQVSYLSTILDV